MIWFVLLCIILILILFSSVRIGLYYKREENNDRIKIEIGLLNGLIPIRIKVPGLQASDKGITYQEKLQSSDNTINKEKNTFTLQDLKEYHRKFQELLERIVGLQKIVKRFLAKIKIIKLTWWSRIGTGDAAETGILLGLIWGIKGGLIMLLSHFMKIRTKPSVSIEPSFMQACLYTEFECILQFRVGNAILAGILFLIHLRKGRRARWENIRFKDS